MRFLLTGAWSEAKNYIPEIVRKGHSVVFMQQEKDELPCDPATIQGVVCNGLFLFHDIKQFTSLKFIQLTSAGLDRVPAEYIKKNNIALFNARGVYNVPMAEHAVCAVLVFFRNSRFFFENQTKNIWQKRRDLRELCGSTVCIIGCGSVGSECAKRFYSFGAEVIGVDLDTSERQMFSKVYGIDRLFDVIPEADVIVLTLPLSEQTEGIVDEAFLSRIKPGCVLVNISRGKIIKTGVLIDALSEKKLYAAIDVFEDEPLSGDSPLWGMENVILTPHNSFVGDGNNRRLAQVIMRNIPGETDAENIINSDGAKSHMSIS